MIEFYYSNGLFYSQGNISKDNFGIMPNTIVRIICNPPYRGSIMDLANKLCSYINSLCLGFEVSTWGVSTNMDLINTGIKNVDIQLHLK